MINGTAYMGAAAAPGGGGPTPVSAKIATFRPGVVSDPTQNVFATWAEIQTWIGATDGYKIVQVDDRVAAATTGGTGITDADSNVLLRGVVDEGNPGQAGFGFAQLSILDGDTLNDFTQLESIQLLGNDTTGTADSLTYSFTAITQGIVMNRSRLRQNGTNPMVNATNGLIVQMREQSELVQAGAVIFSMLANSLRIDLFDDSDIESNVLANSVGAFINIDFDRSSRWSTIQGGVLGNLLGNPFLPNIVTSTIVAGVLTVAENIDNFSTVRITNEGGADDDLDTINGPSGIELGMVLIFEKTIAGGGVTTVVEGGNIILERGNALLTDDDQRLMMQWDGTNWIELARHCGSRVRINPAVFGENGEWIRENGQSPANNNIPYATAIDLGTGGIIENQFNDGALDEINLVVRVPDGIVTSQNLELTLRWFAQNANIGNVQWLLTRMDVQDGDLVDGTAVAPAALSFINAASGVANQLQLVTLSFGIVGAFSPGDDLVFKLTRDARAGNLNDTYVGNASITTWQLTAVVVGG